MSGHVIRWSFEDQHVIAEAVCRAAPDADCRLTPADHYGCQCEYWGDIERRDDGTIWHHAHSAYYADWEGDEPVKHQVVPGDDCNVCLHLNESGCIQELTDTKTVIDLGETAIEPVWIDDGCDWAPVCDGGTT